MQHPDLMFRSLFFLMPLITCISCISFKKTKKSQCLNSCSSVCFGVVKLSCSSSVSAVNRYQLVGWGFISQFSRLSQAVYDFCSTFRAVIKLLAGRLFCHSATAAVSLVLWRNPLCLWMFSFLPSVKFRKIICHILYDLECLWKHIWVTSSVYFSPALTVWSVGHQMALNRLKKMN